MQSLVLVLETYDSIIVGAGHNGLVCATYLAKSGHRVLLLEAADSLGGLAADREFHPGFHAPVAHSINHFSEKVARDLDLTSFGFRFLPSSARTIGLSPDGQHVVVEGESLRGCNDSDAIAFQDYAKPMRRFANALAPFWLKTMPSIGQSGLAGMRTFAQLGLNVRRLGKKDMREFLRVFSLPARDLMDENFESEGLKALLSWDALVGSKMAPRSPNGGVLQMLYRMAGRSADMSGLVAALGASAKASGVEIRCSAEVDRITIGGDSSGLRATGVQLADGAQLAAARVISAADPQRTFLKMVGVEYLDIGFTNRIRRLRCDGYVGKLHLALDGRPEFSGVERTDGRMIIAPDMNAIEFAFDEAKYGRCPPEPVLEIRVSTAEGGTGASTGKHVLSAQVMYVPYQLRGGWTDDARDEMCERAIAAIHRYAPKIREQIVHREFLTPLDLEQQYRVTGGHWHHTEYAIDQLLMMRPTYGAAQYATPIPGLYLCGAGCHPGGDITGAAGHNAAQEIVR